MIYTLEVKCVQGAYLENECTCIIEIDDNDSLDDLHSAIQKAVDFESDHLYEFYAGRNPRQRKVIFDDSDEWEEREDAFSRITLNKVYPLPERLKLYYNFDFGDNWLFEIKKLRKDKEPEPGVSYPRVIESIGENPVQYPSWEGK